MTLFLSPGAIPVGHSLLVAVGAWQPRDEGRSPATSDGLVWVGPYTRTRDGETEEVSGHFRHSGRQGGHGDTGGDAIPGAVSVEDDPGRGVARRTTVRDRSGRLIGRCETLSDGGQICTMAMPDGGIVTKRLDMGSEARFTVARRR